MLKKRLTVTDLRRLLQAAEKDGHGKLEVRFKVEEVRENSPDIVTIYPLQDYSIESIAPGEDAKFFLNFEE